MPGAPALSGKESYLPPWEREKWLFGKGSHMPNVVSIRDLSLHKRKERAAHETLMQITSLQGWQKGLICQHF